MRDQEVLIDERSDGVGTITLNRVKSRNAQDTCMLYAVHDAFERLALDSAIKVIVLRANGPHFSAGNDLTETDEVSNLEHHETVGMWGDFAARGQEGMMGREKEIYFGISERIRAIPKPTIAAVHGKCISGGLMLVWPCDIIIASDDAQFIDNTLIMGIPGVEWFAHPIELGARKAKEMLFTGDPISAKTAWQFGMINEVVERSALDQSALQMAQKIARNDRFALKLTKEAVNTFEDARGRKAAMESAFLAHQLAHAHTRELFGIPIDPRRLDPKILAGTKYEQSED